MSKLKTFILPCKHVHCLVFIVSIVHVHTAKDKLQLNSYYANPRAILNAKNNSLTQMAVVKKGSMDLYFLFFLLGYSLSSYPISCNHSEDVGGGFPKTAD